jgi:hypothetical protein
MSERQLQDAIRQAASLFGWLCYHTHDSRRSPEGFPDLFLVKKGVCYAWELKSTDGHPTAPQRQWLDELGKVPGIEAGLIYPADLDRCLTLLKPKGNR